jgi:hypothetical protein
VASELDDLREQLATDSRRLTAVEEQPSAEAALRAAMDTDQSNLTIRLDAQDNLLRALSITQSDHIAHSAASRLRWAGSRPASRRSRNCCAAAAGEGRQRFEDSAAGGRQVISYRDGLVLAERNNEART